MLLQLLLQFLQAFVDVAADGGVVIVVGLLLLLRLCLGTTVVLLLRLLLLRLKVVETAVQNAISDAVIIINVVGRTWHFRLLALEVNAAVAEHFLEVFLGELLPVVLQVLVFAFIDLLHAVLLLELLVVICVVFVVGRLGDHLALLHDFLVLLEFLFFRALVILAGDVLLPLFLRHLQAVCFRHLLLQTHLVQLLVALQRKCLLEVVHPRRLVLVVLQVLVPLLVIIVIIVIVVVIPVIIVVVVAVIIVVVIIISAVAVIVARATSTVVAVIVLAAALVLILLVAVRLRHVRLHHNVSLVSQTVPDLRRRT